MSVATRSNARPKTDQELVDIADYVSNYKVESEEAYDTARNTLMDALGCGFMALSFPECTRHLGPLVPGTVVPRGARVPGTKYELDPVKAAWDLGCIMRWLDFNDTWLAAEWGHPSDNIAAVLSLADFMGRQKGATPLTMRQVLAAIIKAYEIQGGLALENSFNRVGLDHVLLVRVASAAVCASLLGGSRDQIADTVSHAWLDGSALRTYRHTPNTGPRKSWAAGDASSRGLMLALLVQRGEMGYPSALTAPTWGFYDVSFKGRPFKFQRPYGTYVMENILFKISYPAEFHAQTAVEAAIKLHPILEDRLDELERVEIETHESAMRIISKTGPLDNPADRDHCLEYMAAIGLLKGSLVAEDYSDAAAADPRIDALRAKMVVSEDADFTADYLDPEKRSIANRMRLVFKDGTTSDTVTVEYPLGHRRRRTESLPAMRAKFAGSMKSVFPDKQAAGILELFDDPETFDKMPVTDFVERLRPQ